MAGGLSLSVRQIGSYPSQAALPSDLVLIQRGLGGPYLAPSAYQLILDVMAEGGPLGIGYAPPAGAAPGELFVDAVSLPFAGTLFWNAYNNGGWNYWQSGMAATLVFTPSAGLQFMTAPAGAAGTHIPSFTSLFNLSVAGAASLPQGTLTVGRDPAGAMDVVTLAFMGANTVASFNNRKGVVTLSAADIYGALGICPPDQIATSASVDQAICAAINDLLRTYPGVWSWMGRVGDVFLTVADMNFALANNPAFMPPLTLPAGVPLATASDGEVVSAAWVIAYVAQVVGGTGYATETWVTEQIAAAVAAAVTSFNGRTGAVSLTLADITTAGGAPNASPSLTGTPSAPTAAVGTSTSQIATTAFVLENLAAISPGVVTFNNRSGAVTFEATDITGVGGALLASPNFTGTPTSTTPTTGDSSQRIATTAFVEAAVAAATAGVATFNGRTGNVTLQLGDIEAASGAPIVSPGFSGVPTAPTAPNGTNTTQLATTAFVQNELTAISAGVLSFNGRSGVVTFTANDLSAVNGATLASPAFTGTPSAPTAAVGNNSTQLATTAFVMNAIQGAAVTSFNGRSGTVTLSLSDITGAGGAPLASPALTGLPTAPTPAAGNSSTLLATTAFVASALASYLPLSGGVLSGGLSLAGNATQPLQAVPYQQLTSYVAGQGFATTAQLAGYLPLLGGVLSGALSSNSPISTTSATGITAPNVSATSGIFIGPTGAVTLSAPSGNTLLANGSISAPSGAITAGTNLIANSAVFIGGASNTANAVLYSSGNTAIFNGNVVSGAGVFLGSTSGPALSASGSTVTTTGPFSANGTVTAQNGMFAAPGGTMQLQAGTIDIPNNGLTYTGIGGAQAIAFFISGGNPFIYSNGGQLGWWSLNASDRGLKSNFAPIERDCLEAINAIELQSFDMREGESVTHWQVGYVAQQVRQVMPDAVPDLPGPLGVETRRMIATLIGAVQRLTSRLRALEEAAA